MYGHLAAPAGLFFFRDSPIYYFPFLVDLTTSELPSPISVISQHFDHLLKLSADGHITRREGSEINKRY